MALTTKQEKFCQEVVNLKTLSDAYRSAYDAENMSDVVINKEASILMATRNISVRIKELKEKLTSKYIYTLEKSVKRDLNLIQMYEAALSTLSNSESEAKAIDAAQRTIKFIGAQGYSSAQERLSKQHGFFEKHNDQKNKELSPEERKARLAELKLKMNK